MKPPAIKPWKRGDPLSAVRLDQPRQAIEALISGVGGAAVGLGGSGLRCIQIQITSIEADTVTGSLYAAGVATGSTIVVARPPTLRASVAARGGVDYTYSTNQTREADDGSATETQSVTPSYLVGDIIYAVSLPIGGTGVTGARWIDLNLDARAWAAE